MPKIIAKFANDYKKIAVIMGSIFLGFLGAQCSIGPSTQAIGLAVLAAVMWCGLPSIFCMIGCVLGGAMSGGGLFISMPHLVCYPTLWLFWVVGMRLGIERKRSVWISMITVSGFLPILFLGKITLYQSVVQSGTGLFASAMGHLLSGGMQGMLRVIFFPGTSIKPYYIPLTVLGCVVLMGLSHIWLLPFHPALLAAMVIIVYSSARFGVASACAVGIISGLALSLSGYGTSMIALLGVCGVIAGLGRVADRWGSVLSFMVCAMLAPTLLNLPSLPIADVLLSSILVAICPAKWFVAAKTRQQSPQREDHDKLSLCAQLLKRSADLLDDSIGDQVNHDHHSMLNAALFEVEGGCGCCNIHASCWRQKSILPEVRSAVTAGLCGVGTVLSPALTRRCVAPQNLKKNIQNAVDKVLAQNRVEQDKSVARKEAAQHMLRMSHLLRRVAATPPNGRRWPAMEQNINKVLHQCKVPMKELQVFCHSSGRMRVHLRLEQRENGIHEHVGQLVSRAVKRPMQLAHQKGEKMVFVQKSKILFDFGTSACAAGGGEISGDAYLSSHLPDGRMLLSLADGMGTGDAASKKSREALQLLEEFLIAGLGADEALDCVNRLLLMGAQEGVFSTMDVMVIDPIRASAECYKNGSCPTLLLRQGNLMVLEGGTLPAGVLEGSRPHRTGVKLLSGDVVLMMTDGVWQGLMNQTQENMDECAKLCINILSQSTPQQASERLLETALISTTRPDDMTAIVLHIKASAQNKLQQAG